MTKNQKGLLLPELIEQAGRPWTVHEAEIRVASVDISKAEAWVPRANTPAQKLARMHELGHVKHSPRDWPKVLAQVVRTVGERADGRACLKLLKMLEENRIDWLMWDRYGIDIRPAREVLDWAQMPDPDSLLEATGIVLQLAWTVWASRGLSKGIPNEPPARVPDAETGEYFDKAWKIVTDENLSLAHAAIRACLAMYASPTHKTRNQVAAELAEFFLLEEEKEETPPPVKKEEQEAQEEAEKEDRQAEEEKEKENTGVGSAIYTEGRVEYHDHTAGIRRQSMRLIRRSVPVTQGLGVRYAHRYMLDKAIFSERRLTEGGIMIDGSGSMNWNDAMLKEVLNKLPAVTIGIYSGLYNSGYIRGRICTLAKKGRFTNFRGKDPEMNEGNEVDLEALKLLAKWPIPRLWISDGLVCGGLLMGPCSHGVHHNVGYYHFDGKLHEACNAVMKAHQILRVPDVKTLEKLLKRQRVTLYRTTRPGADAPNGTGVNRYWPADVRPEPITFQL